METSYICDKETRELHERVKNMRFFIKDSVTKETSTKSYTKKVANNICDSRNFAYGSSRYFKVLAD